MRHRRFRLALLCVGAVFAPLPMLAQQMPAAAQPKAAAAKDATAKGAAAKGAAKPKAAVPKGAQKKPALVPAVRPVTALETDVNALKQQLAERDAQVDALSAEMKALRADVAAAGVTGASQGTVLSPIELERKQKLAADQQNLERQLADLEAAIARGLDRKLVATNIEGLQAAIAARREQIANLEAAAAKRPSSVLETRLADDERTLAELAKQAALTQAHLEQTAKEQAEHRTIIDRHFGEAAKLLPIDIYAFGDFQLEVSEADGPRFAIGQAEVDLSQDVIDHVNVAVAVAYDSEANNFGIGAFTINGRLFGADESYLVRSERIESSGVILGQFDVPFGIDYELYPSINRRLVTSPIAVSQTHGAWNDLGAQVYFDARWINFVAYVVNGFDYSVPLSVAEQAAAVAELGDEAPTEAPRAIKLASGGRLGLKPFEVLELGASCAGFFDSEARPDVLLAGGDIGLAVGGFKASGEYIFHRTGIHRGGGTDDQAFYALAEYDFEPVFISARYSMFFPGGSQDAADKQLSAGVGVVIHKYAQIRAEYTSDLMTGGSIGFLQFAGGSSWQPTGLRQ